MSKSIRRYFTPYRLITNLLVFIFSFTCLFPLVWMGYTSLKTNQEYTQSSLALPEALNFSNYYNVLVQANFGMYFTNSAITAITTMVVVVLFAFIAGYFLSRYRFKGRSLIYGFFMLGLVVPTYAWLLPIFIQFKQLGLLDHYWTLALPYSAFALPMSVFLVESFVKSIPTEMEEAAMIEGCSIINILRIIIFPLCTPILVTILILVFNNSWNELPFGLVLINLDELRTVPVALTMFTGTYTVDYPYLVTALVIAVLPVVLFYVFFSKRIMEGMTAGAVKG
ncbi:carbohydrate ABC transporter permease [uncultured Sphaerochaeta sp.]|uniref:carbohydrate ABC transporter permease n=1 Tax=uncultured Sphaerochaeta sp. TaxID=886478 RepID=UPI0029C9DEDA|nr:carbohydrate ABC transporter permease [uncultured Sphaerochaeta sp.]